MHRSSPINRRGIGECVSIFFDPYICLDFTSLRKGYSNRMSTWSIGYSPESRSFLRQHFL